MVYFWRTRPRLYLGSGYPIHIFCIGPNPVLCPMWLKLPGILLSMTEGGTFLWLISANQSYSWTRTDIRWMSSIKEAGQARDGKEGQLRRAWPSLAKRKWSWRWATSLGASAPPATHAHSALHLMPIFYCGVPEYKHYQGSFYYPLINPHHLTNRQPNIMFNIIQVTGQDKKKVAI